MKISDKELKELVDKVKDFDLEENINSFPNDEIDGRSELDIVLDEVEWLIYCYEDYSISEGAGFIQGVSLLSAKKLLEDTENGKRFEGFLLSSELQKKMEEVKHARRVVDGYNRLKRLFDDLCKLEKQRRKVRL